MRPEKGRILRLTKQTICVSFSNNKKIFQFVFILTINNIQVKKEVKTKTIKQITLIEKTSDNLVSLMTGIISETNLSVNKKTHNSHKSSIIHQFM